MGDRTPPALSGAARSTLSSSTPSSTGPAAPPKDPSVSVDLSAIDTRNYVFCPLPERVAEGTTIDGFSVIEPVGHGSMATVYRARQVARERDVALKILSPHLIESADAVERFEREARLAGRIADPGIVPVYASGVDGGYHYYAMKWMSEPTLAEFLDNAVGEPGEAFYRDTALLFAGLARTAGLLHSNGVVHRDIKPGNLFLTRDGRLMVSDFGVAADIGDRLDDGFSSEEGHTTLLGTPAYMAPERFVHPEASLDPRTDVYSIGMTLYEALTGVQPFLARDDEDVARLKLTRKPPAPRELRGSIPLGLEAIVRQAIETHVELRHQTADELARDLERFANTRRTNTRSHPPPGPSSTDEEPPDDWPQLAVIA